MAYQPFSLANKTLLITGASSGIGRQTAINCSFMGAQLILLGRNEDALTTTLESCDAPASHRYGLVDLGEENFASNLDEILGGEKLNGFVHAAGISPILPLRSLSEKRFKENMQINLNAGIQLARLITKKAYIPDSGQSLVFIASVMASVGEPARVLYGATKGGLIAAVKSMAVELAPKNIRVNGISPGVVETPMAQKSNNYRDESTINEVKDKHPLGLGETADVADACVYLLSDAAKWVTGTNLVVDGGYTAQ